MFRVANLKTGLQMSLTERCWTRNSVLQIFGPTDRDLGLRNHYYIVPQATSLK